MSNQADVDLDKILTDLTEIQAIAFALTCVVAFTPAWEALCPSSDENIFASANEAIQRVISHDSEPSRRSVSVLFNTLREKQLESVYASLPREVFVLRIRRIACSALDVSLSPTDVQKRLTLSDVCMHFAAELDQLSNSSFPEQRKTRLVRAPSASGPLEALEVQRQLSSLRALHANGSTDAQTSEYQDLILNGIDEIIRIDEQEG